MKTILHKEIHSQPEALRRFIAEEAQQVIAIAAALRERPVQQVIIAARGTSDNAALYARYLLETFAGWPVSLAAPSVYTLYQRPPRLQNALVIGISQSGEAVDVTEVLHNARSQGAVTLAITNNPDSPLAQAAEFHIHIRAGVEKSIAATKTYTSELFALAWLAAALEDIEIHRSALESLPDQLSRTLTLEDAIRGRAERYRYANLIVTLGRGFNYATAFEIAHKLKELTYMVAEPYSSADFRHGPIAIVEPGFPALVVAPSGGVYADLLGLIDELSRRRADMIILSDRPEALEKAVLPLLLPFPTPEWLTPILYVVPGQLLAYHLALAKGISPDNPRLLKKVTLTR